MQWAWDWSLVGELGFYMPHSVTKKKKKKRICNSWEVQGKSQCFHKLTTVSSNEAHGSQITDVKGFAIKMLVVIIYTLLLIQKSLLHPSKLLDCLVCLQWTILRVCIQFWAGTSVLLRALWVSGHSLNVKKRSIWCQVQWLRHKIWLTFLLSKVFLDNKFF